MECTLLEDEHAVHMRHIQMCGDIVQLCAALGTTHVQRIYEGSLMRAKLQLGKKEASL